MIIRTYQPGKVQNLYDHTVDKNLAGVLYFGPLEQSKVVPEQKPIEQNTVRQTDSDEEPISILAAKKDFTTELAAKFLDFAFRVDRVVMGGFHSVQSRFFASYQWLYAFISTLELATVVEKNGTKVKNAFKNISVPTQEKVRTRVSRIRRVVPAAAPLISAKTSYKLPKLSLPALSAISFSSLRLPLAGFFLLLSLISVMAIVFPLISAQLFSVSPSSKPIPTATPFRYNSYLQAENNPLYPISEFRLVIPKINLESNVVGNVDTTIEGEYKEKLQYGVAHAKGSYLPAENGGPVYLFAHSTDTIFNIARFNAKFYSVRELEPGDKIQVYFNGKEYNYVVRQKFIINPKEVDVIKNATSTDLILQTCWPPGTDWQRLIVYADKV